MPRRGATLKSFDTRPKARGRDIRKPLEMVSFDLCKEIIEIFRSGGFTPTEIKDWRTPEVTNGFSCFETCHSSKSDGLKSVVQRRWPYEMSAGGSLAPFFGARTPTLVRMPFVSRLAERFVEGVAGAAHGSDRIALAPTRQRLAQPADVDVDRAFVDLRRLAPHPVQ
jgi:hypothetical protein